MPEEDWRVPGGKQGQVLPRPRGVPTPLLQWPCPGLLPGPRPPGPGLTHSGGGGTILTKTAPARAVIRDHKAPLSWFTALFIFANTGRQTGQRGTD